jgi:hypothetical protein
MQETKDIEFELQEPVIPDPTSPAEDSGAGPDAPSTFEQLKQRVSEDDEMPSSSLTLKKVLGGDILSAQMVRSQVWLIMLIALFVTVYVASRYQCQQDMLDISKLERKLTDAKYRALSSASVLTGKSRESQITKLLRANSDSLLSSSDQPPYIVKVPAEE